jgi:hypothetical protein
MKGLRFDLARAAGRDVDDLLMLREMCDEHGVMLTVLSCWRGCRCAR